jgi:hypothetical protein
MGAFLSWKDVVVLKKMKILSMKYATLQAGVDFFHGV